jgi:hypothetical protein
MTQVREAWTGIMAERTPTPRCSMNMAHVLGSMDGRERRKVWWKFDACNHPLTHARSGQSYVFGSGGTACAGTIAECDLMTLYQDAKHMVVNPHPRGRSAHSSSMILWMGPTIRITCRSHGLIVAACQWHMCIVLIIGTDQAVDFGNLYRDHSTRTQLQLETNGTDSDRRRYLCVARHTMIPLSQCNPSGEGVHRLGGYRRVLRGLRVCVSRVSLLLQKCDCAMRLPSSGSDIRSSGWPRSLWYITSIWGASGVAQSIVDPPPFSSHYHSPWLRFLSPRRRLNTWYQISMKTEGPCW